MTIAIGIVYTTLIVSLSLLDDPVADEGYPPYVFFQIGVAIVAMILAPCNLLFLAIVHFTGIVKAQFQTWKFMLFEAVAFFLIYMAVEKFIKILFPQQRHANWYSDSVAGIIYTFIILFIAIFIMRNKFQKTVAKQGTGNNEPGSGL